MYYLDGEGKRVYTLKVGQRQLCSHMTNCNEPLPSRVVIHRRRLQSERSPRAPTPLDSLRTTSSARSEWPAKSALGSTCQINHSNPCKQLFLVLSPRPACRQERSIDPPSSAETKQPDACYSQPVVVLPQAIVKNPTCRVPAPTGSQTLTPAFASCS